MFWTSRRVGLVFDDKVCIEFKVYDAPIICSSLKLP